MLAIKNLQLLLNLTLQIKKIPVRAILPMPCKGLPYPQTQILGLLL